MITLAITDDNDFLRQNIIERLKEEFHIVFEASSAKGILRFLRTNAAADHPQVILMDIEMDEMDGIQATAQINQINPQIRVIMLTVFEDEEKVFSAIKAGAVGYLVKDERKERMIECIHDVAEGGSYLSPSVAIKALQYLQEHYSPQQSAPGNPLSKREREILKYIIDGNSYAEIGVKLFISMATVKSHVYHIYEKLQVSNKIEAAKKATGNKWI